MGFCQEMASFVIPLSMCPSVQSRVACLLLPLQVAEHHGTVLEWLETFTLSQTLTEKKPGLGAGA